MYSPRDIKTIYVRPYGSGGGGSRSRRGIPLTPTLLGHFLLSTSATTRTRTPVKGYRFSLPRTLRTQVRRLHAVERLRFTYRVGMNRIAKLLRVSSRTVWRDVQVLRRSGFAAFDAIHVSRGKQSRGIRNAKGSFMSWSEVSTRLRAYILGFLGTVFDALGEDPP